MTKAIIQRRHKQIQLRQKEIQRNQFTRIKDFELKNRENPLLWAESNLELLYSKCIEKTKSAIIRDQEKRAECLAEIFKSGKYNSLKLLDGDGRMLAQIIIAFYRNGLTLPDITVVEIDKTRYIYHCNNLPLCINKEYGDIFSTAVDITTYVYYNFCSIGFIVNQGNFMSKLERTANYMLGFTLEGSFRRKNTYGKKQKTEMKTVIPRLKKMKLVSKRGGFYITVVK